MSKREEKSINTVLERRVKLREDAIKANLDRETNLKESESFFLNHGFSNVCLSLTELHTSKPKFVEAALNYLKKEEGFSFPIDDERVIPEITNLVSEMVVENVGNWRFDKGL